MYTKIKRDELIYYINSKILEMYSLDLLGKRQLAALAVAKISADDEALVKITDEQFGTVAQG